jgi:hypothetical protein
MSVATAIGKVSESLRNLLIGEMNLSNAVQVTILAPDEHGSNQRINLFLYKVQENPYLKNMDWQIKPGISNILVPPPLSLNLFYLMTSYAPNDTQTGNSSAHEILGEAMRVFYENPIVPGPYLDYELQDSREQVKIMNCPLDMDELSRVWSTFTQPFRLSVLYEISLVQLDMLSVSEQEMAKRVQQIGTPQINAPFIPPEVENLQPVSGKAGDTITFYGKNLKGWKAYVYLMRQQIADLKDLAQDNFSVTLPNNLSPGFHEIRVDISHLFLKTFFFEVTT